MTATITGSTHQGEPSAETTRRVHTRLALAWIFIPLFFYVTGGTLDWWQAWAYCVLLLVPMTAFVVWMVRVDPAFLERRLTLAEKERTQRRVLSWGTPVFAALLILPGLDRRFGWSAVPAPAAIAGLVVALLSYLAVLEVFVTNRWAGRTVETAPGQEVVSSGPYAIVRHPMYAASLVLYLATPVALGSWWALIPAALCVPVFVMRIGNEEHVLLRELAGYAAYREKVRYRLVPHVW